MLYAERSDTCAMPYALCSLPHGKADDKLQKICCFGFILPGVECGTYAPEGKLRGSSKQDHRYYW